VAVSNQFTSRYKNMKDFLSYYMGKNTPERQTDIVANLRIEKELEFKEELALPEAA
jgi:topoisomerase-4 subunit B